MEHAFRGFGPQPGFSTYREVALFYQRADYRVGPQEITHRIGLSVWHRAVQAFAVAQWDGIFRRYIRNIVSKPDDDPPAGTVLASCQFLRGLEDSFIEERSFFALHAAGLFDCRHRQRAVGGRFLQYLR